MPITPEQFTHEIQLLHPNYTPSPKVLERMGRISLTLVTGPAGVGKNTVMAGTQLPRVVSDTIRAQRSNNGVLEQDGVEYFFRSHELDAVLREVKDGSFVQIALGPSGKSFYASRASQYPPQDAALMDVLTPTVSGMMKLPFERVSPVQLVAPSYKQWIARLDGRGALEPQDRAARIVEAERCIEDGLDGRYTMILNNDLSSAVSALRRIAVDGDYDARQHEVARATAVTMLKELRLERA